MLTIGDDSRLGRRDFLKVGSLGLGGLSLGHLLNAQVNAAPKSNLTTGKSVVFLFMHGGPSQVELFDPKMEAPSEIRSATGEVATKLPGITFGGTLPRLAALNDKFSIVRSFRTGDGNHDIKPVVSKTTFGANYGSLYSRVVGTNNPENGMPTNLMLFPQSVDPSTQPGTMAFGNFSSTGTLGNVYSPFVPGSGGEAQENLRLRLPMDRLDDRKLLLTGLDQVKWGYEKGGDRSAIDKVRDQAFNTIVGGVADAFDLTKEDPNTVARYDTAPLLKPQDISRHWNNYKNYVDNGKTLGKLLLLARRLCERGAGVVTVTTNFVWDMHADVNNATVEEGMRYMGIPFDHAVSAFIEDCEARGLGNDILLVCCGEMGRTPRKNNRGGRDHWGGLAPLMLYGGGLKMGQVIGQSSRDAGEPRTEPIEPHNLVGTIMHTLFHVGELRLSRSAPGEVTRVAADWQPIPGLM